MFKDLFNRLVKISWASSPLSLQGVLESIADTPAGENSYKLGTLEFTVSREEREKLIKPIVTKLKELKKNPDIKIRALSSVIQDEVVEKRQKIIIFCERRATVVYLSKHLKLNFPSLDIAFTIEQTEDEKKFQMKDSKEIEQLIEQFALQANKANDNRAISF